MDKFTRVFLTILFIIVYFLIFGFFVIKKIQSGNNLYIVYAAIVFFILVLGIKALWKKPKITVASEHNESEQKPNKILNNQIENIQSLSEIDKIKKKRELLKEAVEQEVISKNEYQNKIEELDNKEKELEKQLLIREEEQKEKKRFEEETLVLKNKIAKLDELRKGDLLTQEEYKLKFDELKKALSELEPKFYYISYNQERGPYTKDELKRLKYIGGLSELCEIRYDYESNYDSGLRIKDVIY